MEMISDLLRSIKELVREEKKKHRNNNNNNMTNEWDCKQATLLFLICDSCFWCDKHFVVQLLITRSVDY